MRKVFVLLLAVVLLLPGCDKDTRKTEKNEIAEEAVDVLKDFWEDKYQDADYLEDGYFEIKNTRVIYIQETDIQEFENVSCIVDFVLYTNYLGTAPYYLDVGTNNAVVVYRDGTTEVSHNPILIYRSRTYNNDLSGIVDHIVDYHDQYNCVEDLLND